MCIRDRLTRGGSGPNMALQSPAVQTAFAKRLEELLFKTSKSIEAYVDSKTLDRRLQSLLSVMQKRKARRDHPAAKSAIQKQQATSKGDRKRAILRSILGREKATRVHKVVAEIKLIQLGREVTAGKPYESDLSCTRFGCSFLVPCAGEHKAPQVVRDLFFHTSIVCTYEHTLIERFAALPWDQLWHKVRPGCLPTTSGCDSVNWL